MNREKLREFDGSPHLNVPTIAFLEYVVNKDSVILEFGSGSSTLWFAKRSECIISYESEKKWWEVVAKEATERGVGNLDIRFEPRYWEYFEKQLEKDMEFDIILIDGAEHVNARESCIRKAWKYLAKGGYFVVDDTHKERYRKEVKFIDGWGWEKWEMTGKDFWGAWKKATVWRRG